ncbi:atrial natriuretic peptide receptor 1-like isoform X2 [Paramacrobiotus metropolitanus]|uniref:atrial natriuretic peptide receptor 1-like isoform X2 n=1 Tax=Paramacrobiotus metropolitanus TaxID=2943436 RepID=UPI002445E994|nr:atrial natriuretic peptide receptor 1-like isoform X2 [Paramacrobiotus metropolitanus]
MYPSNAQILCFLFLSVCAAISCVMASAVDVALMQFYLWGDKTSTSLSFVAPVMAKAEEDLASYKDVMNITRVLIYDRNVTTCDGMDQKAAFWATRYYYHNLVGNPVLGIFGPGCRTAASSVASLAREWNTPMLTSTFEDYGLSNKKRYPTLTNFSPYIHQNLNMFLYRLLDHFGYSTVGILCDDANDNLGLYVPTCTGVFDTLRLQYNISASRFYVNATDELNVKFYLEQIKSIARVVIIIAHGDRIRPIMLAALDKKMTEGDYVYFAFEPFPSKRFFGSISWDTGDSDKRGADARTAFRSLFVLSLRKPDATPEYRKVTDEIKRRSQSITNYTYAAGEEVNPFAMAYYYALGIYAKVVNHTIAAGGNPQDAYSMSKMMWNRTYTILGQDIIISANGDRETDWTLNQIDVETGMFLPVMEYSARRKIVEPSRDPVDNSTRQIVWYNRDSPPPNEPKCGYRGVKPQCDAIKPPNQYQQLAAAVLNLFEVVKGMF